LLAVSSGNFPAAACFYSRNDGAEGWKSLVEELFMDEVAFDSGDKNAVFDPNAALFPVDSLLLESQVNVLSSS
jgi:hypothetical protein